MTASTPRRLWAFVRSLPPDSAWRRQGKQWTNAHELAAQQVEATRLYGRATASSVGAKFTGQPPGPIEHPDRHGGPEKQEQKRMSTREEISGFLKRVTGR